MLHQIKPVASKSNTHTAVHGLSYTELAAALHASGVPTRSLRSATPKQLTEWAARGVELAGLNQVRATAQRTLALNFAAAKADGSTPANDAEYSTLWSSPSVAQRCHNAAFGLIGKAA